MAWLSTRPNGDSCTHRLASFPGFGPSCIYIQLTEVEPFIRPPVMIRRKKLVDHCLLRVMIVTGSVLRPVQLRHH